MVAVHKVCWVNCFCHVFGSAAVHTYTAVQAPGGLPSRDCYAPESVATLPPFSPIEGQKWFDQISSQWESQKNRFALIYIGKIQFLPPCIWNLPFMSTASERERCCQFAEISVRNKNRQDLICRTIADGKSGNFPGRNLPTCIVINLRSSLIIINQSTLNLLHGHFILIRNKESHSTEFILE